MADQRLSLREQLEAAATEHGLGDERPAPAERGAPRADAGQDAVPARSERPGRSDSAVIAQNKIGDARPADAPVETRKDKPAQAEPAKDGKPAEQAVDATKGPARGTDGKFVSKKYPGTWKKDFEPLWNKPGGHTPEEWATIQAEAERRENDFSAGESNWRKRVNEMEPVYKGFSQIFEPYKDRFARTGVDPLALTRQLVAMADFFDRDPAGFITEQARLRGLDLAQLVQQQQGDGQAVDPKVAALEGKLRQLEAHLQGSQRQSEQQIQAEVHTQVETFRTAANEDGSAKHPHFDRLKVKIGHLMAGPDRPSLEQAYDQACNADPEVRQTLIADEWERREKARLADVERAAAAAKSARGGTGGGSAAGGQQPLAKGSSIRAQLSANWDRVNGDARVQ